MRPKLRAQLIAAFEASGLPRLDYVARVQMKDEGANALLDEALAELDQKLAKQQALRSAFQSSGKTAAEFADMYGLDLRDVMRMLDQAPSQPGPAPSRQADELPSDLA